MWHSPIFAKRFMVSVSRLLQLQFYTKMRRKYNISRETQSLPTNKFYRFLKKCSMKNGQMSFIRLAKLCPDTGHGSTKYKGFLVVCTTAQEICLHEIQCSTLIWKLDACADGNTWGKVKAWTSYDGPFMFERHDCSLGFQVCSKLATKFFSFHGHMIK